MLEKAIELQNFNRKPPILQLKKKGSLGIGEKASRAIHYGFEQAKRIGLPLTHMVTINFSCTACDPSWAVEAFSKIRNIYLSDWLKEKRITPTWVYVFENARFDTAFNDVGSGDDHNIHVHLALHLPSCTEKEFELKLLEWIEATAGEIIDPSKVIHITDGYSQLKMRNYMLKGCLYERWARRHDGGIHHQGRIIGGWRSNTSRNIGNGKRKATDAKLGVKRFVPPITTRVENATPKRTPNARSSPLSSPLASCAEC